MDPAVRLEPLRDLLHVTSVTTTAGQVTGTGTGEMRTDDLAMLLARDVRGILLRFGLPRLSLVMNTGGATFQWE